MYRFFSWIRNYKKHRAAATGVEYALMAAGISMSIMFAVFFFGDTLVLTFTNMFATMEVYLQQG